MEEEDKEFFILVLGVLAAIILVITWWFSAGGTATASTVTGVSSDESADRADDGAGDAEHGEDTNADASGQTSADPGEATGSSDPDASDPDSSPGSNGEDASSQDTTDAPAAASVFDAIAAEDSLSVLRDLLRDADLDQVLATGGPFTVFAPSNDAIAEAAGSDTTVSLLENNSETVLRYHVLPGRYTRDELSDIARGGRSTELTTMQGESISLTLDSDRIMINGSATVSLDSINSGNGIVHTLDNVLIPPVAALNTLVGLDPILFASGSADIEPGSFDTLDRLIEVLQGSNVDVTIEGHTDSSGDVILNQNLSQSRARSVLNYLVGNGIDESRLGAQGFGPDQPVADNATEEGRALNRRIEFTLG